MNYRKHWFWGSNFWVRETQILRKWFKLKNISRILELYMFAPQCEKLTYLSKLLQRRIGLQQVSSDKWPDQRWNSWRRALTAWRVQHVTRFITQEIGWLAIGFIEILITSDIITYYWIHEGLFPILNPSPTRHKENFGSGQSRLILYWLQFIW